MTNLIKVGELNTQEVMSSLQIAEVTGKAHDKVCRDIGVLLSQGVDIANFGETSYRDKSNRNQRMYELTKKGCLILASGYDAKLREAIINRWEELEKSNTLPTPQTYLEALKALVASEEEKQTLALENAQMQPKAEYFDALVERNLSIGFRDTAKELGVKQNSFINWLLEKGFIFRDSKKSLKPYAEHVTSGLFEVKEFAIGTHAGLQTLITTKGRQKLIGMINQIPIK